MKREKGSITIFSMLALLLITAALFALLEGTRYQEIRRFAGLQTESALESVFANYNSCLWEKYHILGADFNQMDEILQKCADGRVESSNLNLLSFHANDCEITDYTLLTDNQGMVFIQSVSTYMKDNILYETAKEIYNQYDAIKNLLNASDVDLSNIEDALEEIEVATLNQEAISVGTSRKSQNLSAQDIGSILEEVQRWQEYGILELVIKDTSEISEAEYDFSNGILERELNTGKNSIKEEVNWIDKILLQQYLLTYMSNYREAEDGRALSYETEYLLGNKSSDKENLQIVVSKLLTIREAANFLYLVSNPSKNQQAELLATMIGGTTLSPVIIEVIKIGILTAWAFAESVLDVRALLEGKKISLMKSDDSWTVEFENLGSVTQEFVSAKESTWGLSYENYLGILLLFEEEEGLAMYAMNAQEATIRKTEGDSFGMDYLVAQASAKISYSYKPIFPFLQVIDAEKRWEYQVTTNTSYGYYH